MVEGDGEKKRVFSVKPITRLLSLGSIDNSAEPREIELLLA